MTCTTVEHHVVDRALLEAGRAALEASARSMPSRVLGAPIAAAPDPAAAPAARQLVIDLGLPRNVAPDVALVSGVELLDLETIRVHAPLEELGATDAAREIVASAARSFGEAREELDVAPAVVALRRHVFDILDAEIARAQARGDDDGRTEAALRHMAGVLLHTPMVRSREHARAGEQRAWIDGIAAVFGVTADAARVDVDGLTRLAARRRRFAGRRVVTDTAEQRAAADAAAAASSSDRPSGRCRACGRGIGRRTARASPSV